MSCARARRPPGAGPGLGVRPALGIRLCAALLGALALPAALAGEHDQAPRWPPPPREHKVVRVATEAELQRALATLTSSSTVMIAPGVYDLTRALVVGFAGDPDRALADVAIRGASGNPDEVVLRGRGMGDRSIPHGLLVGRVEGILIADLTIRDVYHHAIQLAGERGCRAPRIYNCRLIDAGEQLIKGSIAVPGRGVEAGAVEYTLLAYTTFARSSYTNGVDILGGAGWVIRHNLFRRIRSATDQPLAGAAVLFWKQSRDTVCEGNRFVDCDQGISLGLEDAPGGATDHAGGVIRNNVFFRSFGQRGDACIAVVDSPGTKVLHNTIVVGSAYPNAIEVRFPDTTGVEIRYNLANRLIRQRDGAIATVAGNTVTAPADGFVDARAGDLRLRPGALSAIDRATPHEAVVDDFDGRPRPVGRAPDLGAFEAAESQRPAEAAPPPGCGGCRLSAGGGGGLAGGATGSLALAMLVALRRRGRAGAAAQEGRRDP